MHEEAREPPRPGNLDALVNKYHAAFRKADQPLAQAQAPIQTYRERYPELAFPRAVAVLESRVLSLAGLISHEIGVDELSQAMQAAREGKAMKILVRPTT